MPRRPATANPANPGDLLQPAPQASAFIYIYALWRPDTARPANTTSPASKRASKQASETQGDRDRDGHTAQTGHSIPMSWQRSRFS